MNQKVLWKIEEIWKGWVDESIQTPFDVFGNYSANGVSRYYPRFRYVERFDFAPSHDDVFADEYGKYHGLKRCQVTTINDTLVYLFDNHNEMLYPLVEICETSGRSYDILHIDAHPDDATFQRQKLSNLSIETVGEYIKETRISDFFDAVSGYQGVGDIIRVCHSQDFTDFTIPEQPYLLSLDIDIFGPEGDFVDLEEKVKVIKYAWERADVVCIAMSPGFIGQDFARKIIEIFTSSHS